MTGRSLSISFLLVLLLGFFPAGKANAEGQKLPARLELPFVIVQHIPFTAEIILESEVPSDTTIVIEICGEATEVNFTGGVASLDVTLSKSTSFTVAGDSFAMQKEVTPIPLWMSILPPLIAILFALVFREVFSALFAGLLVGTTILHLYAGSNFFLAIFQGVFTIADTYILEALLDRGHLSIIIFSMFIGGMVKVITQNGGMKGVVNLLSRYAGSAKSGQFITWLMGVIIFFDDYANTLVVGNTMRSVTDRLKISREKLAYLVDSTAAPIASIAFVTTWIGAELSYIEDGIGMIGIDENAYMIFFKSLSYSFYPIFTLAFILIIVFRGVDFGPMLSAERKARMGELTPGIQEGSPTAGMQESEVPETIKARWYNAVIPVLVIILGTITGLIYTGWDQEVWSSGEAFGKKISIIIGNADSYTALLWSSLSGMLVALLLTIGQRLLSLKDTVESLINGFRTMLTAILILTLAWAIALITEHMHTATFISNSMLEMSLSPYLVPALTFILAALVSFSTGSSWGTMAILYPLILPATWLIAGEYGLDHDNSLMIFHNVVACVLTGSVLGDHCSPISDTTILSSLASSCNHIEHVRTQLPYALIVGTVSVLIGTVPAAFGVSSFLLFPAGLLILYFMVMIIGRKPEAAFKKV